MKLVLLALLVVAASASFPAMQGVVSRHVNGIKALAHLMADPSTDCVNAMMAAIGQTGLMNMQQCQGYVVGADAGITQQQTANFCSHGCDALFGSVFAAMASPACSASFPAETLASMRISISMLCLKSGETYCSPLMTTIGLQMANFTMDKVMTDAQMAAGMCHPCLSLLLNAMGGFRVPAEQLALAGQLKLMCAKNAAGHYCLPVMQQIQGQMMYINNMTDHLSDAYIGAMQNIIPQVCEDTCYKDLVAGMIPTLGSADAIGMKIALAHVTASCIKDGSQYCLIKMMQQAKVMNWTDNKACGYVQDIQDRYIQTQTLPDCPAACKTKYQTMLDNIGCCAKSLVMNTGPDTRFAANKFLNDTCGITWPTTEECVKRISFAVKEIVFTNLKWSYVQANLADVKAKVIADLSVNLHVPAEDISVTFVQLSSASGVKLSTTETGTKVQPTVTANSDQQAKVQAADSQPKTFSSTASLPASAAVDPTKSNAETPAAPNSAAAVFTSFAVILMAVVAALL